MHHRPAAHLPAKYLPICLLLGALFAPGANAPRATAQDDPGDAVRRPTTHVADVRGLDRLVVLDGARRPAQAVSAPSELSADVARLVNRARDRRGIHQLEVRAHLNGVAFRQAQRMADRGTLFHNPNLASEMIGDWQWVGENVGYGPDVETVHTAFMNSQPHRANILDRAYTRLGTAAILRGTRVWLVQVFLAK